jgi:ribokinase
VDESGQNQIIVALGANGALAPEDVPAETVTSARILVCQLEANLDATAHFLKTAHDAGVTTILNPAPMRPDFDPSILVHVDILAPNETEFSSIVEALSLGDPGTDPLDYSAEELDVLRLKLGLKTLLITLGSRGSLVCEEGTYERVSILEGITAIDTTGAGDAFVGGFAAGLLRHNSNTVQAARFGNAVAGLSVTKPGTAPSMPKLAEVEAVL